MSWAEIKKAVNSRMSDMPLDEMFGLEFVRELYDRTIVSGTNGFILLSKLNNSTSSGVGLYLGTIDDRKRLVYLGGDNQNACLVPIVSSQQYQVYFYGTGSDNHYAALYAWGGGIS